MDSHRMTEIKNPNSKEGDTVKYYMNLSGWVEPKTHTSQS